MGGSSSEGGSRTHTRGFLRRVLARLVPLNQESPTPESGVGGFFFFLIKVYLIHNIILVPGVQHFDSVFL